ncbi:hypothetical protein WNB94_10750 [Aquabacterium sp. A3]|uniref:hypothetical protein n=1 Tax=Aquabacterium sp. A3 TaxID=3132829 RepID=UPI0031191E63
MKTEKQRTMFYRRAAWIAGKSGNLEKELKVAHKILSSTAERTFPHNEGEMQGLSFENSDQGFCMHIASYVPHQATSLVPFPSRASARNTTPQSPPDKHNYLEGDIFVVIRGNHIVLCPSGARESVAISYMTHALRRSGKDKLITHFSVEPVVSIDKMKIIQQEGVKKIALNASLYEASTDYLERKTTKMTLLNGLANEVLTLFAKDDDDRLKDVDEFENLSVRVEISFDSRKRGGEIGRERLERTAEKVISDNEDDGFQIITGGGKKFTPNSIRINEPVSLSVFGNSVEREKAWDSLKKYLDSLHESGALEQ